MHYYAEVVMPPVAEDKLESTLKDALEPFREDTDHFDKRTPFFDWFIVGGRYSGEKFKATLDKQKLLKFREWLEENVTVSSFQSGKPTLAPEEQIPMVDEKWNEFFPESNGNPCPLFSHATVASRYSSMQTLPSDIMRLSELPDELTCSRLIFIGPEHKADELIVKGMIQTEFYNGVDFHSTTWSGDVKEGLEWYINKFKDATDEYKQRYIPQDDWLVVTLDIHS